MPLKTAMSRIGDQLKPTVDRMTEYWLRWATELQGIHHTGDHRLTVSLKELPHDAIIQLTMPCEEENCVQYEAWKRADTGFWQTFHRNALTDDELLTLIRTAKTATL